MRKNYIIILVILFTINLISQERKVLFSTGIYGSYMRNFHIPDFDSIPGFATCCNKYQTTGYGSGYSLGALFDFDLASRLRLQLRGGLSSLSGMIKEEEKIGQLVGYDKNTMAQSIIPAVVSHNIDASLYNFHFEPSLNYDFYKGLFISGGVNLGYLFTATYSYEEVIVSPDNIVFYDGKATRNERTSEVIPEKNEIQINTALGLGYRLNIAKDAYITPEFKFYYPLTNISNINWKVWSLSLGLNLTFPIYSAPKHHFLNDTTFIRDTSSKTIVGLEESRIVRISYDDSELYKITKKDSTIIRQIIKEKYELQVPREANLTSSLIAYGITKEGLRKENPEIIIEETELSELFPLLPQIFFKEGSAVIDPSIQNLIKSEETEIFNEDNLEWNTLKIYSNLLNIIGYRMRLANKEEITIIGCNSGNGVEKNNLELSKKRAEAIKDYLTSVWKIDGKRIKIQNRNLPEMPSNKLSPDGQAENQRAEIISNGNEILKPVQLKQISRTSNPPLVEILPKVNSEVEIKSWQIAINQEGNVLRKYSGVDIPEKIEWKLEEKPIPMIEAPVKIQLSVINKFATKSVSEKSLQIQQKTIKKKREEIKDDKIIERFALIVFDFDKATITKKQEPILNLIKSRIKPNSKVTIAGYADRAGEAEYNKDLALRRCLEVQKYLSVPDMNLVLQPIGSDELLYNNDIPQGRSYSRTVRIVIETPIK